MVRRLSVVAVVSAMVWSWSCSGGDDTSGTGGGAGGGVVAAGTNGCAWLAQCVGNCAANDSACPNTCAGQATSAAVTRYNTLLTCAINHNCNDSACIQTNCPTETNACANDGQTGTGGGSGGGSGGGTAVGGGSGGGTAAGGGTGAGLTTSGRCEVTGLGVNTCWDYSLTVTTNHNDGVEHYVYDDATSAAVGQNTCTQSAGTFTAGAGTNVFDPATVSASNLSHKRSACEAQNAGGVTATFTEGASCSLTGSLGHCTANIVNVFDPGAQTVTATTTTSWSTP
jgi:hypothetical protein